MSHIVEGVNTVLHDDGSYTTYTVEHVPYQEPLSPKATAVLLLGTLGVTALAVVLPYSAEKWIDRRETKKELAHRQKLNKEIFHQAKHA